MPSPASRRLHAARALTGAGWAPDVALEIGADGTLLSVTAGVAAQAGDQIASGPVVPALGNLHSHAFQRAMAGLTEVAGSGDDSFWTWREEMYRIVGLMTPEDVEAVAARLYLDMLKTGYGAVAEFHYLHHAADGSRHAAHGEMANRILAAADKTGIGMTLLPVFYAHSNFGGQPPSPGQRRFIHDTDGFLSLLAGLEPACREAGATLGYAFHSLRAATPEEMRRLLADGPQQGPLHIHIAEQQREVDDSLAWSGRRPIRWLLDEMPVNERWCLIHATHADEGEVAGIAASGAVAGLCPTTEASLGDGIFPATRFQQLGGRFGVGSDSHVSVSLTEELRLLEYGQRLRDERRVRLAGGPGRSNGGALFRAAAAGGAQALGQQSGVLEAGAVASLVVLDGNNPFISTAKDDQILDRWIFALGDSAVRDVMVAGEWRLTNGRHKAEEQIGRAFSTAMNRLARN